MKRNISIQIKASLLLIVFSMNTVVGFACAIGIDMGFNSEHHHDEEEVTETIITHIHADDKKHHHHEEANRHHDTKESSEKGGCCNDGVIKFQNLDKGLAQNGNVAINVPVFVVILSSFFGIDVFKQPKASAQKYIVRFFHPPPPDIRILIQSFQI